MKTMKMTIMLALAFSVVNSSSYAANVDLTPCDCPAWSFSPNTVVEHTAGQSFQVSCHVQNLGVNASGQFFGLFYASSDTTIDSGDYQIGYWGTPGLAGGSCVEFAYSGIFPTNIPAGKYCVGFIIDTSGQVAETDETNNWGLMISHCYMFPQTPKYLFVLTQADLYDAGESYRSFSPQAVVAGDSGQSFEMHCRVSNSGQVDAGAFTVKFYASTDTTITSSDNYIGETRVPGVAAGLYSACDWTGTFPTGIPAGTYYVGWIIDTGNEIGESDENNNTGHKEGYQLTVKAKVPNVMGMSESQATSAITGVGLAVGRKWYGADNTVPAGYVMGQDPAAGTPVPLDSAVELTISTGPSQSPQVIVPNVVGKTQAAAQSAITSAAGLVVGTVSQAASNTVPQGSVISQSPSAGTSVARGSSVNLVVSSGPAGEAGTTGKIIWVSDGHQTIADSEVPDDQGWVDLLRSKGYVVDDRSPTALGIGYWQTLDVDKLSLLDAADLIIVSRDTNTGAYANDATEVTQWNAVKTPLILLNAYMARSSRWQWINSTTMGARQAYYTARAVDPQHPVFAGVTFDEEDQVVWLDPAVAPGFSTYINTTNAGTGEIIAVRPDNGFVEIVEWAAGTPFYTDSTQTQTPADKRMLFSAGTEQTLGTNVGYGVYDLTPEGEKMFLNAVAYMLGGPVAHWKLDEASGIIAYDSVGEKDGILYNGPVWQPAGGKIGGCLKFDGNNDYVQLPIGSLISSLTDSTFTIWVNWSGTGGLWQRVFDFGSGTNVNMFLTPSEWGGKMRFAITTGGGGAEDQTTAQSALPTRWHHVAVTMDAVNRTHSLYLDGQVVGQNTAIHYIPSSLGNTTQNWLGRSQYAADPYFNGSLDDFRIYDRVLSQVEIAALAQSSSTPPTGKPGITLDPDVGLEGTIVTITGSGLAGNTPGRVFFDWNDNGICDTSDPSRSLTTNPDGSFSTTLTIPGAALGDYQIVADIPSGSPVEAWATFTLGTPPGTAQVRLRPDNGPAGLFFDVSGSGFTPNTEGTAFLDVNRNGVHDGPDEYYQEFTTDTSGAFVTYPVYVPPLAPGSYPVRVDCPNGGSIEASTYYVVTVNPGIYLYLWEDHVPCTVLVYGAGLAGNTEYRVFFDRNGNGAYDSGEPMDDNWTKPEGWFWAADLLIPSGVPAGQYQIMADCPIGGSIEASETFRVIP